MNTTDGNYLEDSPFIKRRDAGKAILGSTHAFALYDGYPVSKGHALIIPHRVYPNYFDSSPEELEDFQKVILLTKQYIDAKYSPQGYNVGINCGTVAGQTVPHMHIHLIPRYKDDVEDPTGGVRGVIPEKQKYTLDADWRDHIQ